MNATSHSQHRGLALLVGLAAAALFFAVASPARATYGRPVKPFHQQHPVRGSTSYLDLVARGDMRASIRPAGDGAGGLLLPWAPTS
jgi:hypothetical protein